MSAGAGAAHPPKPPKAMGLTDLVLLYIVTGTSLRWIATAAAAGPSSILIWGGAFLCFYLPLAFAVAQLSSRYPQEGGLYVWTREAFGPFVAYMCGWSYFCSNLPYFASIFYFDAGNALFVAGDKLQFLAHSPLFFMSFAVIGILSITALNIVGLGVGKWVANVGAFGMWVPSAIIIVMGGIAWWRFGSATPFTTQTMKPSLDVKDMLFWSSIAFAFCGCETPSFMGEEISNARRIIPRALVISGVIVTICYVVGTIAVLLALPPGEVNPLQGLIQAGALTAEKLGAGWIIIPLAILITLSNIGAASGYLACVARIPFVVGIDGMLPASLARVHPRWGTPHIAILVQCILGLVFAVLGQAGTGVKGAYDVLVSMGIIAVFLPYIALFLAVIRLQWVPAPAGTFRLPGGRPVAVAFATLGFLTTLVSIVFAAFPASDEANKPLAVIKIVGLTVAMLAAGWSFHLVAARKKRLQPVLS